MCNSKKQSQDIWEKNCEKYIKDIQSAIKESPNDYYGEVLKIMLKNSSWFNSKQEKR